MMNASGNGGYGEGVNGAGYGSGVSTASSNGTGGILPDMDMSAAKRLLFGGSGGDDGDDDATDDGGSSARSGSRGGSGHFLVPGDEYEVDQDEYDAPTSYKVYGFRWVILTIYCLANLSNAAIWVTFSPIEDKAAVYFDVSETAVNMLALTYQFLFVPGALLASYTLDRKGLRYTTLLGGGLTCLGCAVRYVAVAFYARGTFSALTTYLLVFLGQCLAGLAQPMFVNVPARIAASWFAVDERDIATTVASLFNPIGNAVGQVVSPSIITPTEDDDVDDNGDIGGMSTLMFTQFLMTLVPFVWALFQFLEKPRTPPSRTARERAELNKHDGTHSSMKAVFKDMGILMHNKNFLILLWTFGIGLALFNGLMTIINEMVSPYGYSNDQAGTLGAVLILTGLLGAAVTGVLLDKYHWYASTLKFLFVASTFCSALMAGALQRDNYTILLLSFGIMGLFMIPILPAVIENAVECTYPIPEDVSSGLLLTAGNLIGIPAVFLLQYLADLTKHNDYTEPFTPFKIALVLIVVVALVALIWYKGDYKRLFADTGHTTSEDPDALEHSFATSPALHGALLGPSSEDQHIVDFRPSLERTTDPMSVINA